MAGRNRAAVKSEAATVSDAVAGRKVSGIHVGTWLSRPGDSYCVNFDSRALGLRAVVHRWHDTDEVEVSLVKGDFWRDPDNAASFGKTELPADTTTDRIVTAIRLLRISEVNA